MFRQLETEQRLVSYKGVKFNCPAPTSLIPKFVPGETIELRTTDFGRLLLELLRLSMISRTAEGVFKTMMVL